MYRVAMEAGFSSTRMLNRILRRVEGCSPGAYRLHLNRGRGQGGMDCPRTDDDGNPHLKDATVT
jgi:hypothetical protein